MRWGLIARSETDRGLGIQTYSMYENLKPDKTLVVVVPMSGFKSHPHNYTKNSTVVTLTSDGLIEEEIRDWWKGLDVVVSVETLYDWRLADWAREDGITTVVHGNPEFWIADRPQPDRWWWPTSWRLDHLPDGPVIPVPVPDGATNRAADPYGGRLEAVHVAGNAMADRNGTNTLKEAVRSIRFDTNISCYSQGTGVGKPSHPGSTGFHDLKPVDDRWTMYDAKHVLVLPRRYGGLCLPALEAMASGLAVMMPDCSPNMDWPIIPVEAIPSRHVPMQCGVVETFECYSNALGLTIDNLSMRRQVLAEYMEKSLEWVSRNTWSVLAPLYHSEILECKLA